MLPLPNCFWYYLPDLPFGIQNAAASFQMEQEHLISREASRSAILSGAAGTDVPSLCAFLEILSWNDSEYESNDINYHAPPRICYHINGEVLLEEAPRLMPPN